MSNHNNNDSSPCSSTSTVLISQFSCLDLAAKTKLLQAFRPVIDWTIQNEPEVSRFAVCGSRDEQDVTSIYVIQEFSSLTAYETHKNSPPSLNLLPLLTPSHPAQSSYLLSRPPETVNLTWLSTSSFEKPTLSSLKPSQLQPHIIYATIHTPSPSDTDTLAPYGSSIVHHAQLTEPDCLFYANAKSTSDPHLIAALEIYTDQRAFEAHVSTDVVRRMVAECRRLGGDLKVRGLKLEMGFLTRQR